MAFFIANKSKAWNGNEKKRKNYYYLNSFSLKW